MPAKRMVYFRPLTMRSSLQKNRRSSVQVMVFGPVFEASHSEPTILGGIFGARVGASVFSCVWFRYLTRKDEPRPPVYNVVGITLICCILPLFGIRELVRTLKM